MDFLPNHGRYGDIKVRIGGHITIPDLSRPTYEETHQTRVRDTGRKHDDEYARRVRPSTLQKWVNKFDGSRNPHDHVASFKHVVHAKRVTHQHT